MVLMFDIPLSALFLELSLRFPFPSLPFSMSHSPLFLLSRSLFLSPLSLSLSSLFFSSSLSLSSPSPPPPPPPLPPSLSLARPPLPSSLLVLLTSSSFLFFFFGFFSALILFFCSIVPFSVSFRGVSPPHFSCLSAEKLLQTKKSSLSTARPAGRALGELWRPGARGSRDQLGIVHAYDSIKGRAPSKARKSQATLGNGALLVVLNQRGFNPWEQRIARLKAQAKRCGDESNARRQGGRGATDAGGPRVAPGPRATDGWSVGRLNRRGARAKGACIWDR